MYPDLRQYEGLWHTSPTGAIFELKAMQKIIKHFVSHSFLVVETRPSFE